MCRSFSDKTFVYLVLDACLGGELGDLLQERGKLGEVPRHNRTVKPKQSSIPWL
jgi:hypothetical protein